MKILFLESFCGGSHERVARGFARHSQHQVEIVGLPPRFWKWRMRGAALWFARQVRDLGSYDLVLASAMLDLTDFKALAGPACPPVALYFHENQLSYPLAPGEKRDFHLGFTNIVSAYAADGVLFNSAFHRDDFFRAAQALIRKMPDARPSWMVEAIQAKAEVLYPGIDLPGQLQRPDEPSRQPPLVIWNHRWEYDKDPETFFRAMGRLKERGVPFRLAVLGEQYETAPGVFARAEKRFRDHIEAWGFQPSARVYRSWLSQGTCVVSTAIQENFGISVMEAAAQGCLPLLPDRLSYPELFPPPFDAGVIYADEADLEARLEAVLLFPERYLALRDRVAGHAAGFVWDRMAGKWDRLLATLAKERGPGVP